MSQVKQWKHGAISAAGAISDGFSVFIAWMGHISVWVLFVCMVLNIIQVLPSVHFWQSVIDSIMAVEIITLDIAGFGLRSIAKSMLKQTDDAAMSGTANWANTLAKILIFITILTVALIAIGWLFPQAKDYTDKINDGLILVRIIFIVLFMHTMYELREAEAEMQVVEEKQTQANDQRLLDLSQQLNALSSRVTTQEQNMITAQHLQDIEQRLFAGLEAMKNELITACISQAFDLLKSDVKETRITDEIEAVITPEITSVIEQELPAKIEAVITPEITAEITAKKPEELQDEKPDYWSDVIAKFPRVIEWQSDGLRSVSIDQIMEVTGYTKQKISRANLPEVKGGKKRINNVLNWLQNSTQIPPEKREVKKPRNTQPLTAEIHALKPRVTVKLSPDELDDELTA